MSIISEKRIISTLPFSQKIKSKQQIQRNFSYARLIRGRTATVRSPLLSVLTMQHEL